jgi:hypothetical protein
MSLPAACSSSQPIDGYLDWVILDYGNSMTLVSRSFLKSQLESPQYQTTNSITIRGVGNTPVMSSEFTVMQLPFEWAISLDILLSWSDFGRQYCMTTLL